MCPIPTEGRCNFTLSACFRIAQFLLGKEGISKAWHMEYKQGYSGPNLIGVLALRG